MKNLSISTAALVIAIFVTFPAAASDSDNGPVAEAPAQAMGTSYQTSSDSAHSWTDQAIVATPARILMRRKTRKISSQ